MDQAEEEIVTATSAENARSKELAKKAEKAVVKKHVQLDQNDGLTRPDDDDGFSATSREHHPNFNESRWRNGRMAPGPRPFAPGGNRMTRVAW
jgi:hypothetical protein